MHALSSAAKAAAGGGAFRKQRLFATQKWIIGNVFLIHCVYSDVKWHLNRQIYSGGCSTVAMTKGLIHFLSSEDACAFFRAFFFNLIL